MHHALWLLTKLKWQASLRQLRSSMKSVRGVLMLVFFLGFFSLTILPSILAGGDPVDLNGANMVATYGPLVMLAYTLFILMTSLGEQGINFTGSEVDFLFPAPITRRQLLVYKVFLNLTSVIFFAFFVGTVNRMHFRVWIFGILGTFLTLAFVQLLTMCSALIRQTATQFAHTGPRRAIGVTIIVALTYATANAFTQWDGGDWTQVVQLINESMVGRILLAPFQTFCRAITAGKLLPDFVLWAGVSLAINLALVAIILRVDANFNDVAIRISQKKYDRIRRARSGSLAIRKTSKSTRIPMPAFLGGAGPLLWRQCVRTVRSARGILLMSGLIAAVFAVPMLFNGDSFREIEPGLILGVLSYISFLMLVSMPTGFRVDAARIEVFRSLPVRPWAVCLGELMGPTGMVTAIHWVVFAALMFLLPNAWVYWLIAAVCSPLLNLLLLSVSNGLFLFFPVNVAHGSTPNLQTGMRNMMTFLLQGMAICAALVVIALPAGLVYFLTENPIATGVTAGFFLVAIDVLAVLFVCLAYNRFDVSKHLPT